MTAKAKRDRLNTLIFSTLFFTLPFAVTAFTDKTLEINAISHTVTVTARKTQRFR